MEALQKNNVNKLLRIKLADRMKMPALGDDMSAGERLFEADCPAQGTALTVPIPLCRVRLDLEETRRHVLSLPGVVDASYRGEVSALRLHIVDYDVRMERSDGELG